MPPPKVEKKKPPAKKSLKDDLLAPPQRPSTEAFLDHFFSFAGGPAAVAKMLYTEFQNAPQGSLIRQRILELVMRSMGKADAKGSPLDDTTVLTDADLEREIEQQGQRMAAYYASQRHATGTTDGPAPGDPGEAPPGACPPS